MIDTDYDLLSSQLHALLHDETDALASASNFVALVNHAMEHINWMGIYVLRHQELVLGPFQGIPACSHIQMGDGVCGTAAATLLTQRVADVRCFAGHIACDAASRSELVVPLLIGGELRGVFDIDSPIPDRFSARDQVGIEKLCATFCADQHSQQLRQKRKSFI